MFLYIGGESEQWVRDILDSVSMEGKTVLRLMDEVELLGEDGGDEYDEHIWTSPKNARKMVFAIAAACAQADSAGKDAYAANAEAYIQKIAGIEEQISGIVERAQSKTLVVADRFPFAYFAEEYGLTWYAAFGGCSAETDASAGVVISLIDVVREENLPAVFYLEMSNQNVSRIVSSRLERSSCCCIPAILFRRTTLKTGETYVSLLQKNADNLQKGLK